jgi:hypothetical protein
MQITYVICNKKFQVTFLPAASLEKLLKRGMKLAYDIHRLAETI